LESVTPKLGKITVNGVEVLLRLKYSFIRLIEFFIVLLMAGLSLYSFSKHMLHKLVVLLFQRALLIVPQVNVYLPILNFLTMLPTLIIIIVFSTLLYFYAKGHQKDMDKIYVLSWLMHIPSVLWFSRIDWLQILWDIVRTTNSTLGLLISSQILETQLSFTETLLISITLVAGRILLFYTSQIREVFLELQRRGAEKDDLEMAAFEMTILTLILIGSSIAATLAISYLTPIIKSLLSPMIMFTPYPHIAVSAICLIMIPICIIVYLYRRAHH
jgi:hypothetical protein